MRIAVKLGQFSSKAWKELPFDFLTLQPLLQGGADSQHAPHVECDFFGLG